MSNYYNEIFVKMNDGKIETYTFENPEQFHQVYFYLENAYYKGKVLDFGVADVWFSQLEKYAG